MAGRGKPAKDHPWRKSKEVKDPEAWAEEFAIERADDYRRGEREALARYAVIAEGMGMRSG